MVCISFTHRLREVRMDNMDGALRHLAQEDPDVPSDSFKASTPSRDSQYKSPLASGRQYIVSYGKSSNTSLSQKPSNDIKITK